MNVVSRTLKLSRIAQPFSPRRVMAILALALSSPLAPQVSYCPDGSADCSQNRASNNGSAAQTPSSGQPTTTPSNNGSARNANGQSNCGNNGCTGSSNSQITCGNNGCNGISSRNSNGYCSDGSANCSGGQAINNGNGNGGYQSGNNGRAGNGNGQITCGNNGCNGVILDNSNGYCSDGSANCSSSPASNNGYGRQQPSEPLSPSNASNTVCGNNGCDFTGNAQPQSQTNDLPLPNGGSGELAPPVPPLQLPNASDTSDTAATTPSNPIQPATNRPNLVPARSSGATTTLGVPRPLAPTNPGELLPSVPLEWSGVSGATYYQLAVRDLTTNLLVVERNVSVTSYTAPPYTAGRSYRWNVQACNQASCSGWSASWGFKTAGSLPANPVSQCGQVTRYQQSIIDGYHGLPQQRGVPKPSLATLCRWQKDGSLDRRLVQFQNEIRAVANSGPNLSSAEKHRIASEAVRESSAVREAISDLYDDIGKSLITKGLKDQLPREAEFFADTVSFLDSGIEQMKRNQGEWAIVRAVSNTNFVASYMVDQISGYYTRRLGFDIPVSNLINLSGTVIGVYADAYVSGQK